MASERLKIAVTGHHPDKLGGYEPEALQLLEDFAVQELAEQREARGKLIVYTGMALGWDMAIAEACVSLRIPFVACLPCDGQSSRWNKDFQAKHHYLRSQAIRVKVIVPGDYAGWKMQRRNQYMVNNTTLLLALWNQTSGGTANCVRFAIGRNRTIDNCFERWERFYNASPPDRADDDRR